MSQNHSLISEDDELISESMLTDDEILENQASLMRQLNNLMKQKIQVKI